MKKIKNDNFNLKISVPTKLKEITVETYIEWLNILEINKDKMDERDHFIKQKMVSIFCKVPFDVVRKISLSDVNSIVKDLIKLVNQNSSGLTMLFELEGEEYGFIPDFDDMSFGEYTDLSMFISTPTDFNKVLAILYRKVKRKHKSKQLGITQYTIEEYNGLEGRDVLFNNLTLDIATSALFFLTNSFLELAEHMKHYLQTEAVKVGVSQQEHSSVPSTDGITV